MLKFVKYKGSIEKNQPAEGINALIESSNKGDTKLPDLSQYRVSKIIQIPGDLQTNNFPEKKLQAERFIITEANSEILSRYDPTQLFKAGSQNSQPNSAKEDDDTKQKNFAAGQRV